MPAECALPWAPSHTARLSESELVRVLNDGLEGLHEFCSSHTGHDAVVAGQVAGHLLQHTDAALLISCHCWLATAHCQDSSSACSNINNKARVYECSFS